jgi:RNA polymerase sigma-70 factor (ECF subfamily)
MNQQMNHHAPSISAGAMQFGAAIPEPKFATIPVTAPATITPEDRHAAVCAGAIKYLPDLRAFARSLAANQHQADDLVQTAILRALDASQQFTPGTNFKAWSFTILRNAFYNQWRAPVSRHVGLDDCVALLPSSEPTQEAYLEFCDFRRSFAQLGPDHREALLLVGASGLSYSEAAVVCNCAPGTMKSRVSRGRALLRNMMDDGAMAQNRRDVMPISAWA